jgi:hypothetical protein
MIPHKCVVGFEQTSQGGTTKTSGWMVGDRPTSSPLTNGPIGRSTCKWSTSMSPTSI